MPKPWQWTEEEQAQAKKAHAEFYLQLARKADELYLQGGENVATGLALFDAEVAHIRAGQVWAATNTGMNEDSAQLCSKYPDSVVNVMQLRLDPREQIRWLEQAVAAARKLSDKQAEGNRLGSLGLAYAALGEAGKAIEYHKQALVIRRQIEDKRGESADLGNLGLEYIALGEVRNAIESCKQALAIARGIGDKNAEGADLGNLGLAYASLGEVLKAIEFYEQALAIDREIGDKRGEGNALGNLGNAYADLVLQRDFEREPGTWGSHSARSFSHCVLRSFQLTPRRVLRGRVAPLVGSLFPSVKSRCNTSL